LPCRAYTHRTAIGNERLLAIDGERVLLRVRDKHGGKRYVAVDGQQFVGRWLQHVLPARFKRIRHYGLLAAGAKRERLTAARAAPRKPAANPRAVEDARAFMRQGLSVYQETRAAVAHRRRPHGMSSRPKLTLPTRPPDQRFSSTRFI
jgi:hypothetical protein